MNEHTLAHFGQTTQPFAARQQEQPLKNRVLHSAPGQASQLIGAKSVARRRYQKGSVKLSGDKWIGRWREDVVLSNGTIKRVNRKKALGTKRDFSTKREAQRALDLILAPINSLEYRPSFQFSFREFAEKWMSMILRVRYQASAQRETRNQIVSKLLPTFGDFALKDITPEVIQSYVGHLTTDCGLSAKYVRNIVSTMSAMWRQALDWKYVTSDPFEGVVLPTVERQKSRQYTEEETLTIFRAAEGRFKTFIWIAAETGMRPGEVCGLEWQHIDLTNRVISVVQKAWRGHIQRPKTEAGYRSFAISAQLAEHLREYAESEGLLFAYTNGRPWREEKVREKKLNPLLDSLDIERKGLHSLRHFNATMMDRHNVPVKTRQMRLGHADPRMTLGLRNRSGYTHSVSEDDRRAADVFASVLCPDVSKTQAASAH